VRLFPNSPLQQKVVKVSKPFTPLISPGSKGRHKLSRHLCSGDDGRAKGGECPIPKGLGLQLSILGRYAKAAGDTRSENACGVELWSFLETDKEYSPCNRGTLITRQVRTET